VFQSLKLTTSKRTRPKEDFEITKKGRVKRDKKIISPAYERKYSHKIVQSYSVDKVGRLHGKKGRFQSSQVQQKYDELIERSKRRTEKRLGSKQVTISKKQSKGRFMSANYAFTYECTCFIEEGITTHEDDKFGRTLTHYYTISSSEHITLNEASKRHDSHYPTHTLINIEHSSTKVLSFD